MSTKKKPRSRSRKMPAVLDAAAVRERQKELRRLAKSGIGEGFTAADRNCRWIPEDKIVIGPNGVPTIERRWRRVCTNQ